MMRRRLLYEQPIVDSRIWLIKDGIDIIDNTGGYICSNQRISSWNMSGWSGTMPTLTQEDGYLHLSVSGNPVYGSFIPNSLIPIEQIDGKYFYLDAEIVLSNKSYFAVEMYDQNNTSYNTEGRFVHINKSTSRETQSFRIYKISADRMTGLKFPLQISTRSTSYINIYNMWIE